MKLPFQSVALIGKYKAPDIAEPLLCLAEFLSAQNLHVVVDSLTATYLGQHPYTVLPLDQVGKVVDVAIVLGGDGTMLNIARSLSLDKVPLIGVNQGRLGFLTDLTLENIQVSLLAMLNGDFTPEHRMLLTTQVLRDEVEVFHSLAFNEVVVHRGNISSVIEFEVRIDGEHLYHQRADGLIISTPTGSTAYALSAGGAILHPSLDVIQLVPICPHTLSSRSLVVSGHAVLEILMKTPRHVRVRFDSHTHFDLLINDKIIITRHPQSACILHPQDHSYYHTLREKMLWNQSL
ncbi:MAG: NAD kinase [Gallionella sp.]